MTWLRGSQSSASRRRRSNCWSCSTHKSRHAWQMLSNACLLGKRAQCQMLLAATTMSYDRALHFTEIWQRILSSHWICTLDLGPIRLTQE